jgi:hypothetical protein
VRNPSAAFAGKATQHVRGQLSTLSPEKGFEVGHILFFTSIHRLPSTLPAQRIDPQLCGRVADEAIALIFEKLRDLVRMQLFTTWAIEHGPVPTSTTIVGMPRRTAA